MRWSIDYYHGDAFGEEFLAIQVLTESESDALMIVERLRLMPCRRIEIKRIGDEDKK